MTKTARRPMRHSLTVLDEKRLAAGVRILCERDSDLAKIVKDHGSPPLWARQPGFPTLVHIILEQQVSLASARAAYQRLLAAASPLTPRRFLALEDGELKTIGFSRQKTRYGRLLAESIIRRRLKLTRLAAMDDEAVRSEMIKIKGIGHWTIDIYMLMALGRPDVWPSGDLALATAVQKVKKLSSRPGPKELNDLSLAWQPWRAVAARLFWHYYLAARKVKITETFAKETQAELNQDP
jgi:DNA-3-methyladenine glycosylase II